MRAFIRTIGIDYSGAETPTASLKGCRSIPRLLECRHTQFENLKEG